jgi:hypothetical protein
MTPQFGASLTDNSRVIIYNRLPNCLFNVIELIPFWEMESSVLSAKVTSSTK